MMDNTKKNPIFFYLILFCTLQLLYIDSTLSLQAILNRRLVELLTSAKLLYNTSLLKLSLKLLQGALDVFALFNRNYNHFWFVSNLVI